MPARLKDRPGLRVSDLRMKRLVMPTLTILLGFHLTACMYARGVFPIPESSVQAAFGDRRGAFVMIDCATGTRGVFNAELAAERLPPCSTFKVWNTLIGAESGVLTSPEQAFYRWDGVKRFLPEWNKDLTLAEAFRFSCVPAFQNLARNIGNERMRRWIDRIGYGDRDISAGLDVFWLPEEGRKTILISTVEQADLLSRLTAGRLPVRDSSRALLREVMKIRASGDAVLFGKTGSGTNVQGRFNLGWFIGYTQRNDHTRAFACMLKGGSASGKEARELVELLLEQNGHL